MFTCILAGGEAGKPAFLAMGLDHEDIRRLVEGGEVTLSLAADFGMRVQTVSESIAGEAKTREATVFIFAAATNVKCAQAFREKLPEGKPQEDFDERVLNPLIAEEVGEVEVPDNGPH